MESLNPTLDLSLYIKFKIQMGSSVRTALVEFQKDTKNKALAEQIAQLQLMMRDKRPFHFSQKSCSPYRSALFDLISKGCQGSAILEPLSGLIEEMQQACIADIEDFVTKLPFKAMIPLMLLIFPGFLILLIGPLLMRLTQF